MFAQACLSEYSGVNTVLNELATFHTSQGTFLFEWINFLFIGLKPWWKESGYRQDIPLETDVLSLPMLSQRTDKSHLYFSCFLTVSGR